MQKLIIIIEGSKPLFYSSKFPWAGERISLNFINNLGTRPKKGSPALVCALLCVRNQVSHPYKTTDVIIVLCFSACVVRQQTLRQTGDAETQRRGHSQNLLWYQRRVLCDSQPVLMQRNWCGESNCSAHFPEREGSDVKPNAAPL